MNDFFNANEVMSAELDDLLGGKKIKVTITKPDGTKIELEYEF